VSDCDLAPFQLLSQYNSPTPTAGCPLVQLDPYLVPPTGLYGRPKSLPEGGVNGPLSEVLSSTLQMGEPSIPLMCWTRPVAVV